MSAKTTFKCDLCWKTEEITHNEIEQDSHGWYMGNSSYICEDCLSITFDDHEQVAKQANIESVRRIMGIDSNGE